LRSRGAWLTRAVDQEFGEVEASEVVIRSDLDGPGKFLASSSAVAHVEISLAELVVRLGEAGVDLNGVGVLNGRLTVLALGKVFFTALEEFLLAHVGIAGTSGHAGGEERANQQQTNDNGTTHRVSPNCEPGGDRHGRVERFIILQAKSAAKVTPDYF